MVAVSLKKKKTLMKKWKIKKKLTLFIILKNIKSDMYVIALAIEGKMLTSEELSGFLNERMVRGDGNIAFVIGGSLGLSSEVMERADYKLSFSKMTFPHQLMRVILLEQIYRSYRIINNEPYHK